MVLVSAKFHALEVPLVLPTKTTWTAANLQHTVSIISLYVKT
jgi:hypothetical protein